MGKSAREVLVAAFGLLAGLFGIAVLGFVGFAFLLGAGLCEYDNCPTKAETTISVAATAALLAVPLVWMSSVLTRLFAGDDPSLAVGGAMGGVYATYSVAAVGVFSWLDSSNTLSSDSDYYTAFAIAAAGLFTVWLCATALAIRHAWRAADESART